MPDEAGFTGKAKPVMGSKRLRHLECEGSGANPLGRMRSAFAVFQRSQAARTAAQISGAVPGLGFKLNAACGGAESAQDVGSCALRAVKLAGK